MQTRMRQGGRFAVWKLTTERSFFIATTALGTVVAGLGTEVLLGWLLDSVVLKSVHPQWTTMKANTAACFVLLGGALLGLASTTNTRAWPSRCAAMAALLLVLLTFAQYLFGVDFAIDEAMFDDPDTRHSRSFPGRMAPVTAINFAVASLALLLLNRPSRWVIHPSEVLALFCTLVGFLSLAGYVYEVRYLYGTALYTQLAIHTAIGTLLLAIGIISARPQRGLMRVVTSPTVGGRVLRRLLPAAILLPFLVGWLRLLGQKAGFYDTEFGIAVTVTATIFLLGGLIIAVAYQLHQLDDKRTQAEALLRTTVAKLETSNKALEEFARVASHDLQEPLRTVRAFGGLLKADKTSTLSTDASEYLDFMVSGAERMSALVVDLLTYSRVTSRAQVPEAVDLNAVVQEVLADLRERIREQGAKVTVGALPGIEADRRQMRQLLQNLIGNALKFNRPGVPPEVEISSQPIPNPPDGRTWHEIVVRDNGIGIDEKLVEKLFRPFQRLVRREDYEGTGIGLAICKAITERHGGTIVLESKLGSGSRFIVSLPAAPLSTELVHE